MMLFYKAWLETRTRFIVSLFALIGASAVEILRHPMAIERITTLLALHPDLHRPWWIDRILRDYSFYIWHEVYKGWFRNAWIVCAILIALGGVTQEGPRGTAAFSLSLPIRRRTHQGAYWIVGCAELLILALCPALLIPVLSQLVDERYSMSEALLRGLILFIGGSIIFAFTALVASFVESGMISAIVSLAAVIALASVISPYDEATVQPPAIAAVDLFGLIAGPPDLRLISVSWNGLLASVAFSAVCLMTALRVVESRDYR